MTKLTLFYQETCPYCIHAKKAVRELQEENPVYSNIEIEWIEENRQPELAGQYDYYYVPTIFDGRTKLYEASPLHNYTAIKKHIRAAFDAVGK